MASVSSIINNDAMYTEQLRSSTDTVTGADSSNLNQSDFLALLTLQLQYQDPMEPTGNSEFISQMCQFSQLEATTDISETLSDYTTETKASSLVGKGVILADPNNPENTLYGTVEAAQLNGTNSAININGTDYSLEYLLYTYDPSIMESTE